jgi:hypothetical protein
VLVEDALRRRYAKADALGLVQAGDDDRHTDRIARRRRMPLRKDANRHSRHLRARRPVVHPPTG